MSFFKLNDNGTIIECPLFVCSPDYTLIADEHASYTYPVDGWYWYDTADEAASALNIVTVTRAQAKLAMCKLGFYDAINAYFNKEDTPTEYKIAWNDANTFQEDSPILKAVGTAVGLTDDQIKQLFETARTFDKF